MMKEEFEKLLGREVSTNDFERISYVYTWHPSISNNGGKKQIVDIFKAGGMIVIEAMVEVADYMMELEREEQELKAKLIEIEKRKMDVGDGYILYEQCIKAVNEAHDASASYENFETMLKVVRKTYGSELVEKAKMALGI